MKYLIILCSIIWIETSFSQENDEFVSLWRQHTTRFGDFNVVIEKSVLKNLKKIDILKENPPLSIGEASKIALDWVSITHGIQKKARIEEVCFIPLRKSGGFEYSYYIVKICIPGMLQKSNGDSEDVWEYVPVFLNGSVPKRVQVTNE
jgi:hypothetical protein